MYLKTTANPDVSELAVTNIFKKTETVEIFKLRVQKQIPKVAAHHFIMKQQQDYIKYLNSELKDAGIIIVTVDFGENYAYIL